MSPPSVTVICDKHGPMQFRVTLYRWTCAGYDGEGCASSVDHEHVNRLKSGSPQGTAEVKITIRTD